MSLNISFPICKMGVMTSIPWSDSECNRELGLWCKQTELRTDSRIPLASVATELLSNETHACSFLLEIPGRAKIKLKRKQVVASEGIIFGGYPSGHLKGGSRAMVSNKHFEWAKCFVMGVFGLPPWGSCSSHPHPLPDWAKGDIAGAVVIPTRK